MLWVRSLPPPTPPSHDDTKWLRYLSFDDVAIALLKVYNEYKRSVFQGFSSHLSANRMTVDRNCWLICFISIYTLSDLGILGNLIGSLSLASEHYSPPTE